MTMWMRQVGLKSSTELSSIREGESHVKMGQREGSQAKAGQQLPGL